jgi:predicted nicotinamide N-methyase
MAAFNYPIYHYSRHVQWGGAVGDADIILFGPDYSGATFVLTLASAPGAAAVATLNNAAAGTQGVSATFEDPFTHPTTGEVGSATIIRPQLDEATMEALTWGADPAAPLELYYDLLMTPAGAPQRAICFGSFTLYPGIGD